MTGELHGAYSSLYDAASLVLARVAERGRLDQISDEAPLEDLAKAVKAVEAAKQRHK